MFVSDSKAAIPCHVAHIVETPRPITALTPSLFRNIRDFPPSPFRTSPLAIYAIGDIATYPGKLKLILCGFSEAAMAAHAIFGRVYPNDVLHWEYSTTKGVVGF